MKQDMKKMIKRKYIIILVVLLIIPLTYISFFRKKIKVSDIAWDCKKRPCEISFFVKNRSSDSLACKVAIKALRRLPKHSPETNNIAGEKILDFILHPNESRIINENLKVSYRPDTIQVFAYNISENLNAP